MEAKELKEQFLNLYNYIIASDDEDKMHVLGNITKNMMMRAIETSPQQAQEWIDKLQSVKWNNYLTEREAETMVDKLEPKAKWSHAEWMAAIKSKELPMCEEPYYNSCALYATMSMITSASGKTLKNVVGIESEDKMFDVVYHLALDKLKDRGKMFNIRRYFGL